jgi:hypothetical protein
VQISIGLSPANPAPKGAFSPASISGLQLWLDASDASTLFQNSNGTTAASADGDPVGYWGDKSANGRHATQSDGTKKPALKLALENGRNAIRFDVSNDTISGTAGANYPRHTFVVMRFPVSSLVTVNCVAYRFFTSGLAVPNSRSTFRIVRDGVAWADSGFVGSQISYSDTGKYLIEFVKSSQSSDELLKNGSSYQTFSNATVVNSNIYTMSSCGVVCEYLVFDQSLSVDEKTSVRNYLNAKWSIY